MQCIGVARVNAVTTVACLGKRSDSPDNGAIVLSVSSLPPAVPDHASFPHCYLVCHVQFAVFLATYLFIAVGKLPGYHLDRAGAALPVPA